MIREKNYCEECRYSREFDESMVNEGRILFVLGMHLDQS